MTHQQIETLLLREAGRQQRHDLRHLAFLPKDPGASLPRWRRQASLSRCALAACLLIAAFFITDNAVAQPVPHRHFLQGDCRQYCYIYSFTDPLQAYETLQSTLLQS